MSFLTKIHGGYCSHSQTIVDNNFFFQNPWKKYQFNPKTMVGFLSRFWISCRAWFRRCKAWIRGPRTSKKILKQKKKGRTRCSSGKMQNKSWLKNLGAYYDGAENLWDGKIYTIGFSVTEQLDMCFSTTNPKSKFHFNLLRAHFSCFGILIPTWTCLHLIAQCFSKV
jgi:hypothetical protein